MVMALEAHVREREEIRASHTRDFPGRKAVEPLVVILINIAATNRENARESVFAETRSSCWP
jgi:hypothetical protein